MWQNRKPTGYCSCIVTKAFRVTRPRAGSRSVASTRFSAATRTGLAASFVYSSSRSAVGFIRSCQSLKSLKNDQYRTDRIVLYLQTISLRILCAKADKLVLPSPSSCWISCPIFIFGAVNHTLLKCFQIALTVVTLVHIGPALDEQRSHQVGICRVTTTLCMGRSYSP